MKLSLMVSVAAAALMLAAPQASAGGYKPYVSVFGGAAILTQNPHLTHSGSGHTGSADVQINNPGYIIGGAVGVDWGNQIRTELEFSHARWSSDKYFFHSTSDGFHSGTVVGESTVSATYLLGNAWLDLNQGSRITPYVGGGVGIGWANANIYDGPGTGIPFSSTGLAFQIGAGVRFDLSEHLVVDAGYRFKDIVGLNYNSDLVVLTDTNLASHNFQIGLAYSF